MEPTAAPPSPPSSDPTEPVEPPRRRGTLIAWSCTAGLLILSVVISLVGAALAPEALLEPEQKLAGVETVTVVPVPYDEQLEVPARLAADRSANVSSEISEVLDLWLVEEGGRVEAGQVVARLNQDALLAQLKQLEAQERSTRVALRIAGDEKRLAEAALRQARTAADAASLGVRSAESGARLAATELARARNLVEANVAPQAQLDTAENASTQAALAVDKAKEDLEQARIGIQSAEVGLTRAEGNLALQGARLDEIAAAIAALRVTVAKTELRAPISGRLEEHLFEPGQVVGVDVPIATIYDLGHLRAEADVADRYVAFLDRKVAAVDDYLRMSMPGATRNLKATVIIPGLPRLTGGTHPGLELPAEIARIAQASDPVSNTFRVELRFANPGGALKQGIIGRARIAFLRYADALLVPLRAVQVSDVGPRVLVAEQREEGTFAAVRDVDLLSIKGDRVLVGKGLSAGDQLIVAGGKGIVHGERVRVVLADGNLVIDAPERPAPTDDGGE